MGFEKLLHIEKTLKEFKKNLPNIVVDIIKNDNGEYLDLNRLQMSKGENRTETPIGRLKNPNYAAKKVNRGGKAPLGYSDLKSRPDRNSPSDYYANLKKKVTKQFVNVFTADPDKEKVESIKAKYGENHFNLSEKNQGKYSALVIKPELIKILRRKVNAI